ncbi:MAG: aldehyde dehydrogenase family protein, partial [Anaerolineales bacterium]
MKVAEILHTLEYGLAPEAAKPALEWIAAHEGRFQLFINNQWRDPAMKEWFDSINPANAKKLGEVAQAGAEAVNDAVKAARKAFAGWSKTPGHIRARYLYALARQIQKHSRLFAVLETLDNGKPIRETRDLDIPLVARHFYHHAGWAQLMDSELRDYGPVGVVGQIIPWNFPLLMLSWKIAPALAMGNTVVMKPAEFTSLTALLFAEMCANVGLPPGVVNIITGDGRTGAALVDHPDVDKIAFTGSTDVGRIIRKATAGTDKKLSLELGGKSPFIVFDDADLDSAVEGVVDAIWFNQGQVCCAGSRLLVQEGVAESLYAKLRARMEKLRVADPLDKAVDIGAIIAPVQLQKIQNLVQQGVDDGATMWQPSWSCPTDGYFYPPTLFTNVAPASTIAQIEIFGPVLAAMTFRTPEEAVKLANNTRFGLAASIWSEDINLALDIATQIKAGTIWINSTNLFDAASGFGGYRESGFGREGGKEGLWEYVKRANSEWHIADGKPKPIKAKRRAGANGAAIGYQPSAIGYPPIDRTAKMFINGKQARPDSGYSRTVYDVHGNVIGEVGAGNRKDVRNAVEAARAAAGGENGPTGDRNADLVYVRAETMAARADEFARRIAQQTGADAATARAEVDAALEHLFTAAAWADKY